MSEAGFTVGEDLGNRLTFGFGDRLIEVDKGSSEVRGKKASDRCLSAEHHSNEHDRALWAGLQDG